MGGEVHKGAPALALSLLAVLTGCSWGGPPGIASSSPPSPLSSNNRAPIANAGADLVTIAGQSVALSAEASSDPDGDVLSYAWNVVAGTGGGLTRPDEANASFLAALPGTYIVEITVRDAGNRASHDIVVVDVMAQGVPLLSWRD